MLTEQEEVEKRTWMILLSQALWSKSYRKRQGKCKEGFLSVVERCVSYSWGLF